MKDEEFEDHCKKLESYFKNAMTKYQWIVPHLNDTRRSGGDVQIQAETDFLFAIKHFEKIVELVQDVGIKLGVKEVILLGEKK